MKIKVIKYSLNNKAFALIITLWIVIILTIIAYSLSYELRMDIKISQLYRDDYKAYALARAGVAKGISDLKNDTILDNENVDGNTITYDANSDIWAYGGSEKEDLEYGEGTYSYKVSDEESKLDINKVPKEVFYELLLFYDIEKEKANYIASAIVDWRDYDTVPSIGLGNEEDEEYSKLLSQDQKKQYNEKNLNYRCKNEMFTTVDEILNVYGITPELYYGTFQKPPQIFQKLRLVNKDGTVPGLKDFLTITSTEGLNVNTAKFEVLFLLITTATGNRENAQSIVDKIIEYRQGQDIEDIDDDKPFFNVSEITRVTGAYGDIIPRIESLYRLITTSYWFTITSTGRIGDVKHTISAKVRRNWEEFLPKIDDGTYDDNPFKELREKSRKSDNNLLSVRCISVRIKEWIEY